MRKRRRVGRRVGAADRRRGRPGAREGATCPAPKPRARASRRSIPRATARSSTPATASRSTSSPRSPARCAPAPGSSGLKPQRRHRRGRVAVGVRARHLLQRRAAADPRVRRVLRAQPRRGRAAARRRRASTPTSPASIGGTTTIFRTDQTAPIMDIQTETDVASILNSYAARQPDTEHFRLWEVAGTAHADVHLVGAEREAHRLRRADQQRPDAHRRQGGAARAHDLARRPARRRSTRRASTSTPGATPDDRPQRRRHRARRHPHAAGRRAGRRALGRAGPEPVDDLPAARLDEAVHRGAARRSSTRRAPQYLQRYKADADEAIKAGFVLPADRGGAARLRRPVRDPGLRRPASRSRVARARRRADGRGRGSS